MNDNIESLWMMARNRCGDFRDRRTPSPGIASVLVALWENGSGYGAEIVTWSGQHQGNVALWLAKLRRFGFVDVYDVRPEMGHQRGGRPAMFWELTSDGFDLAGLLVSAADRGVAA